MNDQPDFERLVADSVRSIGSVAPSAGAHELTSSRVRQSRQDPEWLALIKESPMRSNSHVVVGSPIAQVLAILAATLLLAVSLAAVGIAGQRLLAANGPIVVAHDGSGDHTTINEAVAAAADGDEIHVMPGTYAEVVVIDKDITLRGDGAREEVVLEFGSDGPVLTGSYGRVPYGLMLVDTEATVSDLTVRGPNVAAAFVLVGGAPTLERVSAELEGDFAAGPHTSIAVLHGAGGTIKDSLFDGLAWHAGVEMIPEYEGISGSGLFVVEDNVSETGFGFDVTDGSVFRRNTITAGGLWPTLRGSGSVLIAENELVEIGFEDGPSDGVTIRDNTVIGGFGMSGIELGTGTAIVEGNTISGMLTGIVVPDGATPRITGNLLEGTTFAIRIDAAESAAMIEGNRFCDNDQNLVVDGAEAALDPSNEVCDDPADG